MTSSHTSREELEAIIERWMVLWQGGSRDLVDDLHAERFHDYGAAGRDPSRMGFKEGIEELYRAFPDFYATTDDMVIEEKSGKVAVRWSATGSHEGGFMGFEPTHRQITFHGIEIVRVVDGVIVERWGEWDGLDLLEQLSSESDVLETKAVGAPDIEE
jgi:predicted ester cyclase